MTNDKGVRVVNCPLGYEYCYPSCYWRKGNRCYYTNKHGGRIIKLKKGKGEHIRDEVVVSLIKRLREAIGLLSGLGNKILRR